MKILSVNLLSGVDPAFVVRSLSSNTDLVSGNLPILNVNIALLLTLRAVLGSGTVTLTGVVELVEGEKVGLFYVADGLSIGLDLGGPGTPIVWSMHQITE